MPLAELDAGIAAAGLLVGFLVGMTGIGGGALTTPILILIFRVSPLAAVGSDLVASVAMKVVGGGVHWRRGTVRTDLVRWLSVGSLPAAFGGVALLRVLHPGSLESTVERALGVTLLFAVAAMAARPLILGWGRTAPDGPVVIRPLPTALAGAGVGLAVGLTSVGSGSLMIVMLLFLYPGLRSAELVGTDLVQAALLVSAAAAGHALFGAVQLSVTTSLLLGALPGVYVGARLSSRAPDRILRPILAGVLLVTGLKLV